MFAGSLGLFDIKPIIEYVRIREFVDDKIMDTSTQRELRYQEDASGKNLVARAVGDRVSVGSGMDSPVALSEEIMKDNGLGAHPTTQIESERNLISDTEWYQNSERSSENNFDLSENEKIEEACYSLDMLDFFETQYYSSQKRRNLDPTVPATSFTLFPFLPVELQRKIWVCLLPPPSVIWAEFEVKDCYDKTKMEFRVRHARSAINFPASLQSFVLRSVNYISRQLFFEHYSYLKFIGDANKKARRFSDWDDSFRYVEVKRGVSPLLDNKVDNLYITNLFGLPILFHRYETSVDLTALRCLTVDIVNIQWMNFMPGAGGPDTFLKEIERLCPNLKELFIVLNKTASTRDPRQLHEYKYRQTNTQFMDFNQNFIDQLGYCQWIEPCKYYPNIEWEINNSSRECSKILRRTGSNAGFWSSVVVKPVWMVHTVAYSVERSRNVIPGPFLIVEISRYGDLHLRCNPDGTLPDQYDWISELFDDGDDEDGGDMRSLVDGEALVVFDSD
ncbi:hypothetical protein sscle_06g048750 [Sclerotinia sclerotiorum 1980 UF-70]|uniref:2EXR domain-containing protein n=1 Tax=Sclerotinia sclerotiorum (strain ATCC 18683 / 1980 / Ss-1) TaxID=665079 RepID=A0A1D9Q591_SCLS1|nr:hypothetical protein sscle_06g048750 [Sclerotinia sclerotiorum 1980 UF-70]